MIINRSDCIANFQFEENVTNSVISGTNGTVTGTTQYADSISGKAFDFDASTYVDIGNGSLSNSSDLTIFLRMNLDAHSAGDKIIVKGGFTSTDGWELVVASAATDTIRFRVRNSADTSWINADLILPETSLYAIRCEVNLSNNITLSAYTTGGVYTTATTTFSDSDYSNATENISIGDNTVGSNAMDGTVDDVTIVKSILTDEDFYRYYIGLGITDVS